MKSIPPPKSRSVRILRAIGAVIALGLFAVAGRIEYLQIKKDNLAEQKRTSATAQYVKQANAGVLAVPGDMGRYFSISDNHDGSWAIFVRTAEKKSFRYSAIPEGSAVTGNWNWTFKQIVTEK
ncbi:MAG: hypothetical protein ABIP97_04590 [Chthoniobacterales bacterium]